MRKAIVRKGFLINQNVLVYGISAEYGKAIVEDYSGCVFSIDADEIQFLDSPNEEKKLIEVSTSNEEKRFETAEHILAAMLVNPSVEKGDINGLAKLSIQAADTLISEFNKKNN